jgi:nucleotide-binding universal stress UspA family protein
MLENEIVVGLDDSTSAQAALQWAARYARFTYTDVRVIHVSTCSIGAALTLAAGFPGMEAFVPPEPGHLQELTIQQMFEAVHPEPDWVLEYRDGRPGQVLVSESHHAQLLIIGTRERAGLARLLSGSTSHFCLTHATCPVVAVHETEDTQGCRPAQKRLRSRYGRAHQGRSTVASPQSCRAPIAGFSTLPHQPC